MGLTEVRRGRIGVLTDLLFVRIGDQAAVPVPQLPASVLARLTTNTFTLTPQIAYRIYSREHVTVDGLGGFRYYHLSAHTNFDAGPLGQIGYSGSDNWADAIGGARVLLRATSKISGFLMIDAGGGGSRASWEIAYGAGYKITEGTTLQLGYRRLYFNRENGTKFALAATQQGLVIGTTIRFR